MDTQERHELKQNDLEEFLMHLRPWLQKHGSKLVIGLLAIALIIVGLNWWFTHDRAALEAAWTDVAFSSSPAALLAVAEDYQGWPAVQGVALLRGGDQLFQEALMGVAPGATTQPTEPVGEEEMAQTLNQAADFYKQVIALGEPQVLVMNARFRLAAVYESLNDFEAAGQEYEQIIANAGEYMVYAEQARDRLALLDELASPVVFPQAPATQPAAGEPLLTEPMVPSEFLEQAPEATENGAGQ